MTIGRYHSQEYVYFFVGNTFMRYKVDAGRLTLDDSWDPGLLVAGQTAGWAAVIINDWVVGQCNGLPASAALSVFAVNQGDASHQFTLQPFVDDPRPSSRPSSRSKLMVTGCQLERGDGVCRS